MMRMLQHPSGASGMGKGEHQQYPEVPLNGTRMPRTLPLQEISKQANLQQLVMNGMVNKRRREGGESEDVTAQQSQGVSG